MASTVACGQCGAQGNPDDRFCGSCGAARPVAENLAPVADVLASSPPTPPVTNTVVTEPAPPVKAQAPPVRAAVRPPKVQSPAAAVLGPDRDHLIGEAVPNTTYVGLRLQYEKPPEPTFDPAFSPALLKEIFRYALIFWAIWFVAGFVLFWFFLLVTIVTKSPAVIGVYVFGAAISGLALFLVWLLRPLPTKLSEWKFSVDDKGAAGTTAFEHITWAFRRRETPVGSLRIRRINQPSSAEPRLHRSQGRTLHRLHLVLCLRRGSLHQLDAVAGACTVAVLPTGPCPRVPHGDLAGDGALGHVEVRERPSNA